MPNVKNVSPPGRRGFVEATSLAMERFGGSRSAGRVLGHLLLASDAVALDDLVSDLGMSKSSASVATRQLVAAGLVRRLPQPGTRRDLYEAVDSAEPMFQSSVAGTRVFQELFGQGAALSEGRAQVRLRRLADLFQFIADETAAMLARWQKHQEACR